MVALKSEKQEEIAVAWALPDCATVRVSSFLHSHPVVIAMYRPLPNPSRAARLLGSLEWVGDRDPNATIRDPGYGRMGHGTRIASHFSLCSKIIYKDGGPMNVIRAMQRKTI